MGNHEGHTADSNAQSGPYYDIFNLPKSGEAGGLASGTEAYYSFDYANIHFICLNSHDVSTVITDPMMTWLNSDIQSTSQDWIIAFWHHPPYSKGSHDSDTDNPLIRMRERALPILENAGVDLVLSGHSHSYERSFFIDSHYGFSNTLTNAMIKDGGSGRVNDTGPYNKSVVGPVSNEGAVYIVAGASGKISGGSLDHPAMYSSLSVLGSVVIDVNSNEMKVIYLDNNGAQRDFFTIRKGLPNPPSIVTQPNDQTVTEQDPATFLVEANGSLPLSFQWYKNATPIAGATVKTYTTPPTTLSENGSVYTCVVTNGLGTVTSDGATLTVLNDTTPLTVTSYRVDASNEVILVLSEPPTQTTAETVSNYNMDQGISVFSASLMSPTEVLLVTGERLADITYQLTISGVEDINGNVILAGTQIGVIFDSVITMNVRVANGSDDAEEQPSGSVSLTSSDLELTYAGSANQIVGMRFTGVSIPRGSSV